MNRWKLIIRSLLFYRKTHLYVVLGSLMSTAILVGALIVGDSVRHSLRQLVYQRLGDTQFALNSEDRFFRIQLAEELSGVLGTTVAPVLRSNGVAIVDGGRRRANNIQVLGVDSRFGALAHTEELYDDLHADEVLINKTLADILELTIGDEFVLRIEKLDFMPKDVPIVSEQETSLAKRCSVKRIVDENEFGRFNLQNNQITPTTVYLSLNFLSQEIGFDERANILLVSEKTDIPLSIADINSALKKCWTLADAGLLVKDLTDQDKIELRSKRVFIDNQIVETIQQTDLKPEYSFTYFVNKIQHNGKATPYSFVSAPGSTNIPDDLLDNEIVVNEWLAQDLSTVPGEKIELTYYILGPKRELIEKTSSFAVKSIVPIKGAYADRDLLPDFPGLSEVQNCREWHPGIPIDLDKIRAKDEDYWNLYRGTPKAFITLAAAQEMWQNRFGRVTAIRFENVEKERLESVLQKSIDPLDLGFLLSDVKQKGLEASSQSVSFAQLFLGLSFFIIIAALLLTGLLFVFSAEERSEERGLFLALGFQKRYIKRLLLTEGLILILIGCILGSIAGVLYNQLILYALKTVWYQAVGTSALQLYVNPLTVLYGTTISAAMAFLTIWIVASTQMKKPITRLQRGLEKVTGVNRINPRVSYVISLITIITVFILIVFSELKTSSEAFALFFSAGLLLLISSIAFVNGIFIRIMSSVKKVRLDFLTMGLKNCSRKRIRSLTLVGLVASGIFIVFTVGANRKTALTSIESRSSGTGGFNLFGQTSLPILHDLNTAAGRTFYDLTGIGDNVNFVMFRVKEGDDASCLNLNRVSNPHLIAVDPQELAKRSAFSFAEIAEDVLEDRSWLMLDKKLPNNVVPAIADRTVIVWGLGKTVGDTLTYIDDNGRPFVVKLVAGLENSVFQGNIIVSEKVFIEKFPSISGYRLFLVDAPFDRTEDLTKNISWALLDTGLDISPAYIRLAEFNKVENTYLSIFLLLGSFGLILGSIGLGVVVRRNVNEQRGQLALLRAVGFQRKAINYLILSEHMMLFVVGIICGVIASLIAASPALKSAGSDIPYFTILILLVIVVINGGLWTYLSGVNATRGNILASLRNE